VDGQVPWGRDASVIRFCRCPPPSRPALNYMPAYRGQQVYKAALLEHDRPNWKNLSRPPSSQFTSSYAFPGKSHPKKTRRCQKPYMERLQQSKRGQERAA
jgi:hypothetical protein